MDEFYALHLTPASNLASICEHGLLPGIGRNSRAAGEPSPAIYCFTNIDSVEQALYNWPDFDPDEPDRPLALLAVSSGTGWVDDPVRALNHELVVHSPLAPARLLLLAQDVGSIACNLRQHVQVALKGYDALAVTRSQAWSHRSLLERASDLDELGLVVIMNAPAVFEVSHRPRSAG